MPLNESFIKVKPGSARSFGYTFAVVFALLGLHRLLLHEDILVWSLVVSAFFLLTTWLRPSLLSKPNYWWFRFGLLLGSVIAPIVMSLVFLTTIVPIGVIMRILRKDRLMTKFDKNKKSYWIDRDIPLQPMKRQF